MQDWPMAIRVALIDDHEIVREGVRLRLSREPDFSVVAEAGTATEAVPLLRRSTPDVVLVDVDLGGENGVAAITKLQASAPGLKVLILSGCADGAVVEAALLAGAQGFVRKERAGEMLVGAIREIARGKAFLCPDSAAALVHALRARTQASSGPQLTDRETTLLRGFAAGLSYKDIAAQLDVTAKSVETYRARLARKLGLSSRAELIRYAVSKGLAER
jgi:DNA-binding NarL/FixJ family response regulator